MLTSKICTEHAITCIQTAEAFPPGAQREKFFDMAKQWTDLAINIEGTEALAILHRRLQTIHAALSVRLRNCEGPYKLRPQGAQRPDAVRA